MIKRITDLLIVGAGPTGLMAANELKRRNIDFICIEKEKERSSYSKALAIHARTMEMFDLLGIAEQFIERGYPGTGAKLHLGEGRPSILEFFRIESRFPYMLILPQSETEEILESHLNKQGGRIEREHKLTNLSLGENGVLATVESNSQTMQIEAKYLLACDGAHSKVRELLNVEFPGDGENITFFLGDVKANKLDHSYINAFFKEKGAAVFFPFKDGSFRIIGFEFSKQNLPHKDDLSLAELQESINHIVPYSLQIEDPVWLTNFGTARRQVPSYNIGRVFLIGDSAHIHNPLGGQGMNLGIQDATNLAWKLSLVLSEQAHPNLLKSYQEERWPIGKEILQNTNRLLKSIVAEGTLGKLRNLLGKGVLSSGKLQKKATTNLSHIAYHYRSSKQGKQLYDPELDSGALQSGDRAPDITILWKGRPDIRLYEILRKHEFICLIYVEEQDKNIISSVHELGEKIKQKFDHLISLYLVVKGGLPEMDENRFSKIYDVKREMENKLGMKNGHLMIIRPDGFIGFHQRSLNADQMIDKFNIILQTLPENQY